MSVSAVPPISIKSASGNSSSVEYEIYGDYTTGSGSLNDYLVNEYGIGVPNSLLDFLGYTHWGRAFGRKTGFYAIAPPKIVRESDGGSFDLTTSESWKWIANSGSQSSNVKGVAQDGSALKIVDNVTATFYRRTKQGTGTGNWGTALSTTNPYLSTSYTSLDFTTYDYYLDLSAPP
ncbi:hypothetical protein LCGC14_1910300 [marine sediment metagenome]|uniref:Uncharacterized protein n=1 Tax=marine sediment metagenome TaxID=412755 RepID=A0A0F9I7T6_9ZZZZ